MINSFLKKQEYNKLKLVQYIGNKPKTNIQELITTFDLSRTSIKRSISEINTFFYAIPELTMCTINQDSLFNFSLEYPTDINLTTICSIYYPIQHLIK